MRNLTFSVLLAICLGLPGGFTATPAMAGDAGVVTCKYLKAGGSVIELELQVAGTKPVTVIVHQYLPDGVKIVASKPPMKKYNQQKGQAKWLLKNIFPGRKIVRMELDKEVKPGEISGEIRYRAPESGAMKKMLITS